MKLGIASNEPVIVTGGRNVFGTHPGLVQKGKSK